MGQLHYLDAEQARDRLPELLAATEAGEATIITKRGRPVGALVPIGILNSVQPQQSLLPLAGSGRGLWGKSSRRTLRKLRKEWEQ